MKICGSCNTEKLETEFGKRAASPDGLAHKCKSCQKAYDKTRSGSRSREEARKKYAKTEQGRAAGRRAKDAWLARNAIKRGANIIVGNAISSGKLRKQDFCSFCGLDGVRIHAHHDDYAKPLEVRWLCSRCHTDWHNKNGEGKNG